MPKELPIITITTAQKLDAAQLSELKTLVESKVGEVAYEQVVDPQVLGGLKITIGSQEFDATLSGKLKKLESMLTKVIVTTAVPLTDAQRATIAQALEKKTGSGQYREVVDPSVVGGIKLLVGSTEYDGTLKGKLTRLKELLLQTI
jgi:F-type H+-transporting ATPase subunit delta